MFIFFIFFAVN